MMTEQEIKTLVDAGKRPQAIGLLEAYLKERPEDENILLMLGELIYAEGRMAEALNRFNAVLRLNPENLKARNYVTMINNILGYYCKDMFNP